MTFLKNKMRISLILIFSGLLFLPLIETASNKLLQTYVSSHLSLNNHLIRAFDSDLEYRIRQNPFQSNLDFINIGSIQDGEKFQPVYGKLSFDGKEGNLRSAEGDYLINTHGYRGPYFEKKKPHNHFRVIALGDSTTAGTYENELTYPRILQRMLNHQSEDLSYEVLNTGVWGYTSCQINSLYKKEISQFQPDLLILSLGWNDLQNGLLSNTGVKNKLQYCKPPNALEKTKTFILFDFYFQKLQERFLPPKPIFLRPFQNQNLSYFIENVTEIIKDAQDKGISVGLFELPAMFELSTPLIQQLRYPQFSGWDLDQLKFHKKTIPLINDALKKLAEDYPHVFMIDSGISFKTKNKFLFFHDWVHPTGAGNRVLAFKIFQNISNQLNLPLPPESYPSEKDDGSYNQLEVNYLKSLFAANQIEDLSYATCVVLHEKCTHLDPQTKLLEHITSVIEFSLGSLIQFNHEIKTTPALQKTVEKHLLKSIKLAPNISLHYWVLSQLYHLNKQNQLALQFKQKSIQINPLLKDVSFERLYNIFSKKHKPNPLLNNLSSFLSSLSKGPNYNIQYVYFSDLTSKKLNKSQKMDLIVNLYAINPLLFRSIFEYAILYLIEEQELNEALVLTKLLRKFKPENDFPFKNMEDRIIKLMK
jgi:lysophospholipase L1-like esterase